MKLEEYIQQNREAFDTRQPDEQLWERIEARLPASPGVSRPWWRVAGVAAAVVLLVGVGYLLGQYWRPVTQQPEIARLSPAYAKQVADYTQFIQTKRQELYTLTASNPQLAQQFQEDLTQLENEYENLKKQLPANPNQEQLLEAMIQNLQWQLQILNQQLQVIEQLKTAIHEKANEMV